MEVNYLRCKRCNYVAHIKHFNVVRHWVPDEKGEPNPDPILSCPRCYSKELENLTDKDLLQERGVIK